MTARIILLHNCSNDDHRDNEGNYIDLESCVYSLSQTWTPHTVDLLCLHRIHICVPEEPSLGKEADHDRFKVTVICRTCMHWTIKMLLIMTATNNLCL